MSNKIKKFLAEQGKIAAFEDEIITMLAKKCTVAEIQKYLEEIENFDVSLNTLSNYIRTRNLRKLAAKGKRC
jgi:hypothetical protein